MTTFGRSFGSAQDINISSYVASTDAARAEAVARSTQKELRVLHENLARTMLICEALWELLRERGKMTDEDLHKKLYEIDMRDGELDGKNQRKAQECPQCGRRVSRRHASCIYCGQVIDTSVFSIH